MGTGAETDRLRLPRRTQELSVEAFLRVMEPRVPHICPILADVGFHGR
jgi:hypothetical protein